MAALLSAGADENAKSDVGGTPLHRAAARGQTVIAACEGRADYVELLLKAGAKKDSQDKCSQTPLHFAADGAASEGGRQEGLAGRLRRSGAAPPRRMERQRVEPANSKH